MDEMATRSQGYTLAHLGVSPQQVVAVEGEAAGRRVVAAITASF
jgi:hypothetical protein